MRQARPPRHGTAEAATPTAATEPRLGRNRHTASARALIIGSGSVFSRNTITPPKEQFMESSSAVRALAPDLFAAIIEVSDLPPASPVASQRVQAQSFGPALAVSSAMRDVFSTLRRLASTDVTVTFHGETGTGKDVLARAIHEASPRARGPFAVFDCGSVPPNLVESELFGHERGAFTGAHAEHVGAFERAQGGTLFLDEIGELPLDLQPRLLRALE